MRKLIVFMTFALVLIIMSISNAQEQSNYEITIDGKKLDITLGEKYTHNTQFGEAIKFRVDKKKVVQYEDRFVSFFHKGSLSVSKNHVGDGIDQLLVTSALGNGFLIQEYVSLNPESLIDLMIQEITKENMSYGYKLKKKKYNKVLKNGQKLKGMKATLTYKDEENYYTVTSYGEKDKGILVITMLDKKFASNEENEIIDLLWDSLVIK